MTKLRIMSDIHLEHQEMEQGPYYYPMEMEDDHEQVLILAGDICERAGHISRPLTYPQWIEEVAPRFRAVLMVFGNHEYWTLKADPSGTSAIDRHRHEMQKELTGLSNVVLLENSFVRIDDVLIFGATMWTELDWQDPLLMMRKRSGMGGDCYWIKGFTPEEEIIRHKESLGVLREVLETQGDQFRRRVVVTHHAPTRLSIHDRFKDGIDSRMNGMFCNDLNLERDYGSVDLWIHGHTHDVFDYQVGGTRVVANPHGLPWEKGNGFKPDLVIEV